MRKAVEEGRSCRSPGGPRVETATREALKGRGLKKSARQDRKASRLLSYQKYRIKKTKNKKHKRKKKLRVISKESDRDDDSTTSKEEKD